MGKGGKVSKKKKILVAVLLGLALAFITYGLCWADFLVCDAYPVDVQVQGFKGTVNGVAFTTPYALHASGAAIIYDCTPLGSGKWDFTNIRAYNVRGESVGVPFVYPALPGSPANLRKVQ